jgi:hypothetical protein
MIIFFTSDAFARQKKVSPKKVPVYNWRHTYIILKKLLLSNTFNDTVNHGKCTGPVEMISLISSNLFLPSLTQLFLGHHNHYPSQLTCKRDEELWGGSEKSVSTKLQIFHFNLQFLDMKMNCEAVFYLGFPSSTILGRMIYTKQALKLAFFAHQEKQKDEDG